VLYLLILKSVSKGQQSVRKSDRDTPSSTLSSTDSEVAYLTGEMVTSYVRPVPLRPRPPPVLVASVGPLNPLAHLQSFTSDITQHSLIDVNELVRDVLRQTSEIEERRTQSEGEQLKAERQRVEAATQLEERRLQAEQHRTEAEGRAERERDVRASSGISSP